MSEEVKKTDGETVTFQDKEGKYTLTVKAEFLTKCPEPSKLTHQELNANYYLFKYLHNPSGPAVIAHRKEDPISKTVPRRSYWLDGICLEADDIPAMDRIIAEAKFNDTLESIVNS